VQARSKAVLSDEDEEVLWWLLQRHAAPAAAAAHTGGCPDGHAGWNSCELCLNYDRFTQARGPLDMVPDTTALVTFQHETRGIIGTGH
jgi:hypothetical protein